MIRTFNFWFIVAPLMVILSVVFAIISITEENSEARKRGSDRFWMCSMAIYAVVAWWGLTKLLIAESLLGMIEYLGRDNEGVESYARGVFFVLAMFWAALIFFVFVMVRYYRFKRINHRCEHGRSKDDTARRKRAKNNDRRQKKLDIKRKRMIESGKIYVLEPKTTDTAGPNAEQQRAIEYRVNQLLEHYNIEERDNLDCSCDDDSGKHPITKYVPRGVYKYYVAVNTEDTSEAPLFLGCDPEKAKENLRRYLTEQEQAQVCAKKVKSAINQ